MDQRRRTLSRHILSITENPVVRECPAPPRAPGQRSPLRRRIRLEPGTDDIDDEEVYFNSDGCCTARRRRSMLVEKFNGKHIDEVKKFAANDMLELFAPLDAEPAEVLPPGFTGFTGGYHLPSSRGARGRPHDNDRHNPNVQRRGPPRRLSHLEPLGPPRRALDLLDNAASTQRPRQVIAAIVDCYEGHYANVHRGIHQLAQESDELFDDAREKVRGRCSTLRPSRRSIFSSGATAGINLVRRSWGDANLRPGDEILLTEMEHHSNLVPWQQLARRTGAHSATSP